jgi:hypothetical protein
MSNPSPLNYDGFFWVIPVKANDADKVHIIEFFFLHFFKSFTRVLNERRYSGIILIIYPLF